MNHEHQKSARGPLSYFKSITIIVNKTNYDTTDISARIGMHQDIYIDIILKIIRSSNLQISVVIVD